MLKIRLQRVGRKHEPTFRVVLTDSKNSTKSGKFLEVLGSYDPRKKTEVFEGDKIKSWVGKGAQLSDTLKNLLITHKIIEGKKVNVLPKKSPIKKEVEASTETSSTESREPAPESPKAEVPVEEPVSEPVSIAPEEKTPEIPASSPEEKPTE